MIRQQPASVSPLTLLTDLLWFFRRFLCFLKSCCLCFILGIVTILLSPWRTSCVNILLEVFWCFSTRCFPGYAGKKGNIFKLGSVLKLLLGSALKIFIGAERELIWSGRTGIPAISSERGWYDISLIHDCQYIGSLMDDIKAPIKRMWTIMMRWDCNCSKSFGHNN